MRERFIEKNFAATSLFAIKRANDIIAEYQAAGYTLTLRQLYYQFVARGFIENKQSEYKRLGSIVSDARLAGLVDWSAIEDHGRNVRKLPTWSDATEVLAIAAERFRLDPWTNRNFLQPRYVEVWIEKEALLGVIADKCNEWRVPYFACKGYASQSSMYEAGSRLYRAIDRGQSPLIFHLGDHDPSGLDMTRDIQERLSLFAYEDIELRRLALNMDQVNDQNPPPNPAKVTDSRFERYQNEFGNESWELDALEPVYLNELVDQELKREVDAEEWSTCTKLEEADRDLLATITDRFPEIRSFLDNNSDLEK